MGFQVFPVVSVLMTRKTKEAYVRMLRTILAVAPGFRMPKVMCDYETALFSAISEVFPLAIISGCFFHIKQVE